MTSLRGGLICCAAPWLTHSSLALLNKQCFGGARAGCGFCARLGFWRSAARASARRVHAMDRLSQNGVVPDGNAMCHKCSPHSPSLLAFFPSERSHSSRCHLILLCSQAAYVVACSHHYTRRTKSRMSASIPCQLLLLLDLPACALSRPLHTAAAVARSCRIALASHLQMQPRASNDHCSHIYHHLSRSASKAA